MKRKSILYLMFVMLFASTYLGGSTLESFAGKSGGFSSSSSRSSFSSSSRTSSTPKVSTPSTKSFGTDAATALGRTISKQVVTSSAPKVTTSTDTVKSVTPAVTVPTTSSTGIKNTTPVNVPNTTTPSRDIRTQNGLSNSNGMMVVPVVLPIGGRDRDHDRQEANNVSSENSSEVSAEKQVIERVPENQKNGKVSFVSLIMILFALVLLAYIFVLIKEKINFSRAAKLKVGGKSDYNSSPVNKVKEKPVSKFHELDKRNPRAYKANTKINVDDSVVILAEAKGFNKGLVAGEHVVINIDMDNPETSPAIQVYLDTDMILYGIMKEGEITETYLMKKTSEHFFGDLEEVNEWIGEEGIIGDHVVTTPEDESFTRVVMQNNESRIQPYSFTSNGNKHKQMLYGKWTSEGFAEFMLFDYVENNLSASVNVYNGILVNPAMIEFKY